MADEEADYSTSTGTYPPPPPFWKHFTSENLSRLKELKEASKPITQEDDSKDLSSGAKPPKIDNLPEDLRYLVPPDPPASGQYRNFGGDYDINNVIPTLSSADIPPLPPPPGADLPAHLLAITRSLLLNFLELLGILANDPAQYAPKAHHLHLLFVNAHNLINEYRPHQARETLILLMEEQLERKRAEVEGVRRLRARVEEVLGELRKEDAEDIVGGLLDERKPPTAEEQRRSEQAGLWAALDEELAV